MQTPTNASPESQAAAAATRLLVGFLNTLREQHGYRQVRVNELRNDSGVTVRYNHSSGIWRLRVTRPEWPTPRIVCYDRRYQLPTTEQLLDAIGRQELLTWQPDAAGEMIIRAL
jgi:hypothetical protein